jgi:hypothetical protein
VVRNRRLGQAGYLWALPLLTHSPGARAHYDQGSSARHRTSFGLVAVAERR